MRNPLRKTWVPARPEDINLVDVTIDWADGRSTVGWLEVTDRFPNGAPRSMRVYERKSGGAR